MFYDCRLTVTFCPIRCLRRSVSPWLHWKSL